MTRSLWVPLDVNFLWDDAIVECSIEAQLLYVRGLCLSKQIGSDGILTRKQVASLCLDLLEASDLLAKDLLTNNLWVERGFAYEIRSWRKHNRGHEETQRLSKIRAEAGRKGGQANRKQVAQANEKQNEAEVEVEERRGERSLTPAPAEPKESTKAPPKGTRIPIPFEVTEPMVEWAAREIPAFNWERETPKFVDFWRAKAGKDGVKLDWVATWRNWMRNANDRSAR